MPKSSQEGLDSQWEGCQSSKHKENSGSAAARGDQNLDQGSKFSPKMKVFRITSKQTGA
jgi:hypothetical protein